MRQCLVECRSVGAQVNYITAEPELTTTVITLSEYLLQANHFFYTAFCSFYYFIITIIVLPFYTEKL